MNRLASLLLHGVAAAVLLTAQAFAAPLADSITTEAFVVTTAEMRRHLAADEADAFRPATYQELEASRGPAQPDYLVVRFQLKKPGHYWGEVEARINGTRRERINVSLHFNKGWVEYFIPLDGGIYGMPGRHGSPPVEVSWKSLKAK